MSPALKHRVRSALVLIALIGSTNLINASAVGPAEPSEDRFSAVIALWKSRGANEGQQALEAFVNEAPESPFRQGARVLATMSSPDPVRKSRLELLRRGGYGDRTIAHFLAAYEEEQARLAALAKSPRKPSTSLIVGAEAPVPQDPGHETQYNAVQQRAHKGTESTAQDSTETLQLCTEGNRVAVVGCLLSAWLQDPNEPSIEQVLDQLSTPSEVRFLRALETRQQVAAWSSWKKNAERFPSETPSFFEVFMFQSPIDSEMHQQGENR